MKFFRKFIRNNKAATAIEYGLIAALIAVGLISTLELVGGEVNTAFDKVKTGLKSANDKAP